MGRTELAAMTTAEILSLTVAELLAHLIDEVAQDDGLKLRFRTAEEMARRTEAATRKATKRAMRRAAAEAGGQGGLDLGVAPVAPPGPTPAERLARRRNGQCPFQTKNGAWCQVGVEFGRPACHIHDPDGLYARQHPKAQAQYQQIVDQMRALL